MPKQPSAAALRTLQSADQCVKCGMCLPHCPTYALTLDEGESPRGRLALMQGLAGGALSVDASLEGHLDRCLGCRACESVCPADVPYGQLIDAARQVLAEVQPQRLRLTRLMAALLMRPRLRWLATLPLLLYQHSGLQWLLRRFHLLGRGRLARLENLMPRVHLPQTPAGTVPVGPVALFSGCTSPMVEPETLAASVQLLEALGCTVSHPQTQTCCGALQQHAGLPAGARACAARNARAFANADTVVSVASGCTAQLVESAAHGEADLAGKVRDIAAFLLGHGNLPQLQFEPLAATVLLHTPCTQRNVVRAGPAMEQLLRRIPGLEIHFMDSLCCGAAGSYFLTQPEMADRLLDAKVAQVRADLPRYVLSSNVGCTMQLAAGLRKAGITAPVWHPVRLLAQQLSRS